MIDDASSVDNDDVAGDNAMTIPIMIIDHAGDQGGRSCTGARVAPAEKFGLRRKF